MFFFFHPVNTGYMFENLSVNLLQELDFQIIFKENDPPNSNFNYGFDIGASKNNIKYAISVKASTSKTYDNLDAIEPQIIKLISESQKAGMVPVLMIYSFISKAIKNEYREKYKSDKLLILDLNNILYLTRGTDLYNQIITELPFAVSQIPFEPVSYSTLNLVTSASSRKKTSGKTASTITHIDLSHCSAGMKGAREFENICVNTLKYIFGDDLSLWEYQQTSNLNLYQFDLVCRIKDYNRKQFWNIVTNFFNSKYVVFEFKNYNKGITQNEIYTTEKYLYSKALRNIAIIIARKGNDKNSMWAAKGCLRENGKLIIIIDIDDVNQMIEIKNKGNDPSTVLLNKLDDLLIGLEK